MLAILLLIAVSQTPVDSPTGLFEKGRFSDALAALGKAPTTAPDLLLQGRLLLLGNRLDAADLAFQQCLAIKPDDKTAILGRAEIAYRKGDYPLAVQLYRQGGAQEKAAQLALFGSTRPYLVKGPKQTVVPFLYTDPLPLIEARVNGVKGNFLIDTGAGETILDPDFAKQVGAHVGSTESGLFAGGRHSAEGLGRVDRLQLGALEIKNVPIHTLSTKAFSAAANGQPVSGIIGTGLFFHFRTTLDYPQGRLIFERDARAALAAKGIAVPFWLAGDHFVVARGRINQSAEHLFFVDTGLAGFAFTGPASTMAEIGVKIPTAGAVQGVGGGGAVTMAPFAVSSLALGEATQNDLGGLYGPFPSSLEHLFGFPLSGIISHQFFRSYTLTIDFTSMTLTLVPGTTG